MKTLADTSAHGLAAPSARCANGAPPTRCARHPVPNKGFTLVELLVVIAIISVLAAMLLPALQSAMAQARHVSCINQLRQHGIAHAAYQSDYDGYFPQHGGMTYSTSGTRAYWNSSPEVFWRFGSDASFSYFTDYLEADLGANRQEARAVNYCPSLEWDLDRFGPYLPHHPNSLHFDYDYRGSGAAGYAFYTGRKWYHLTRPTNAENHDSRPRRGDPAEILVCDLLFRNGRNGTHTEGIRSAAVPWFNPHADVSAQTSRKERAHQVLASGAVTSFAFENTAGTQPVSSQTCRNYAMARRVGPLPSTYANGPYYVDNTD
ncbi:MAG: type II secretion system protein [Planctomycetota bacterium]